MKAADRFVRAGYYVGRLHRAEERAARCGRCAKRDGRCSLPPLHSQQHSPISGEARFAAVPNREQDRDDLPG